jgi:hypothetical protein
MRTIVVALAVALVTASSSTAAFVVTSKNIKNGTIQLVDLSPKAKKALRGSPAVQEITVVSSLPPQIVPPGAPAGVVVSCPAGEQPISGGFRAVGGAMSINTSAPTANSREWAVLGVNSGTTTATVSAIAYCARNVQILPLGTR